MFQLFVNIYILTLLSLTLFQNGDYIEGICSVTGKYTTLILFEKKKNKPLGSKRTVKRTAPPPSNSRGKRLIFQDEANDVSSTGYYNYKLLRLFSYIYIYMTSLYK